MAYVKYVIPFLFFCSSLLAITANWIPDANGNWNVDASWTGGKFPNAADDIAQLLAPPITAARQITLGQDITIGTLNINSGFAYQVLSNNLIFQTSAGNAQINVTTGLHQIASGINLTSPLTITQNSASDFELAGVISGSQPLTKTGAGRVVYQSATANTYTGLTTISAGTLQLAMPAGVNALAGDAIIPAGGTIQFGQPGTISSASTVTISGGTLDLNTFAATMGHLNYQNGTLNFGGGALTLSSNTTALTLGSAVTIADPLTFSGSGAIVVPTSTPTINGNMDLGGFTHNFNIGGTAVDDLSLGGVISNGGITKTGPGLLAIGNFNVANIYPGVTTISDGLMMLNRTGVICIPGDVIINGGQLLTSNPNLIAPTSTVTLNGGQLNLNNQALTIGHLVYNGGLIFNVPSLPNPLNLGGVGATALTMRNTTLAGGDLILGTSKAVVFDPTNNGTGIISSPLSLGPGPGPVIFNIGNGTSAIDLDIQSVISPPGIGGITKIGAGRLAFTGAAANTYNGTTTVSGGVLSLGKTGVNAIVGAVSINGGTLLLSAQEQIENTQTITITAGNFLMNGFTETINDLDFQGGSVTQSGGLLNLQDGGIALTMGGNTSLNGPIALTGGGNILFNGANGTATINGTLNLSGFTPNFSIADGTAAVDMVIGSVISNGGMTKIGTGTLVLLGANTYAGGTTVTAGTLQGTTTSLQGGIINNSTLVFDQNFDGSTSGTLALSGTGNLIKRGSGTVRFVSPQAMTGPTTVAAGTLLINSTFGPLGSLLNVSSGGTLGGTGTINKDVTVGGTLLPGDNGIGTLTLNGTQVMATGSTLEIELTPTSNDLVNIIGAPGSLAIQAGSAFSFTPEPNVYVSPLFYTVVQTTGGVTGTFDIVTDPFPLFQGQLSYPGNDVVLQLLLLPISSVPGLSSNAAKVAHCLDGKSPDSGSDMFSVINDLRFLTSIESIEKALLRMQPSIFTSIAVVKESSTLNFRDTFFNRLETRGRSCGEDEKGYHYWGTPIVGFAKEKTHGKEPGYNAFSPGVALGMDGFILPELQLGGSMAYTHSDIQWNSERGEAVIHSITGAIYGRYGSPVGYLDGAVVLGYDHYSTSRRIWFGGLLPLNRRAKGSHNGFESSAHLKGGCQFLINNTHLGPYASLDFLYIYEGSFSENGANSLNLNIASKHPMLLQSEVGIDFSHCFNLRRQTLIPFVHVSGIWEKRFNGEKEFSHFGKCPLDVRGYYPSRVLVGTGGGFTIEWAKKFAPKVSFSYQGKFGRGYQDQSLNFELIY